MIKRLLDNKLIKFIGNLVYTLLFILVVMMLIVVILQRVTDNSVTIGGYRIFAVASGSMFPKYKIGDVLISKEINPEDLEMYDDIVYKGKEGEFNGKVITHQVKSIRKEENGDIIIITQGIANSEQDPEIDSSQIYGKIIYKLRTLSLINKMIKNIYVFYFLVFVPIALIIFKHIRNLMLDDENPENKEDKEDDEK